MKKLPPPDCDLTLTCKEIALNHGVAVSTAHVWKKAAGMPMRRGRRGVHKSSPARLVSREEWARGCGYVGSLLGITQQAAWLMRNKLIAEGLDIPALKPGRARGNNPRGSGSMREPRS